MSKLSIALLLIFIGTCSVLLVLNIQYASNPVINSIPAIFPTKSVTSENTLTLSPDSVIASAGKPTPIQVIIDSQGEIPNLIQLELAYDPAVLGTVTITPGTFFLNPQVTLNNINERNGRISYALTAGSAQKKDSTTVATIMVTPRINAVKRETTLYFLPKTVIRTKSAENTLKVAYGTKITLSESPSILISPSVQPLPRE